MPKRSIAGSFALADTVSAERHLSGRRVRLSIGVPVYNGETFIEETLDSLLAQSFGDFELIISDNASTDGTGEIAREVAARDERVRYHRHSHNLGLAANYNGLIQMASGDLFKWATADDVCRPTFLECCVAALDETPDAVLAYPRTQFIDAANNPVDIDDPGFPLNWPRAADRWRYVVGAEHWVNAILGVMRRAALLRTRLLPRYPGGDYVLLGELCLLGRFVEVPDVLFLRRLHPKASSQMVRDEAKLGELMTGGNRRIWMSEWRRVCDHANTIVGSGLPLRDKVALLGGLTRQTCRRRRRLLREGVRVARSMLHLR
jgi:glycosyltransferase involved in cell wall biosynthesis